MNRVYVCLVSFKISFCGDQFFSLLGWQSHTVSLSLGGVSGCSNVYLQWHLLRWLLSCLFLSCRSSQVAGSIPPGPPARSLQVRRSPCHFSATLQVPWDLHAAQELCRALGACSRTFPSAPSVCSCRETRETAEPVSRASAYLNPSQVVLFGGHITFPISIQEWGPGPGDFRSPTCLGFLSTPLFRGHSF